MKQQIFISGIGTGIGKTICSAVLVRLWGADYWKPIQSGDLHHSDSMLVSELTGRDTVIHPERFKLKLAVSPHESAAAENLQITLEDFKLPVTPRSLVIEGAGGLFVPVNEEAFIIDLISKLSIPAALVVRDYLGCINHSLLSIAALRQRHIPLRYLILNGSFNSHSERIIHKAVDSSTAILRIPDLQSLSSQELDSVCRDLVEQIT
ncbi:dethiobiotin synthase [Sphingobacterium spiritivorum]|uniref:dethiobiotin synthase n=1 Tax=Sphingobacterium spiritivorum TaxID=258 RepID=UPI00191994CC|nr:dethiobiotin synthase [Sphingobacterium spiritivorum]QQT25170.1 dethiobiotin synthase [Sphingobacterium spiritivorum]